MGNNTPQNKQKQHRKEWLNAKKPLVELEKLSKAELQEAFLYLCNIEFDLFQQVNSLHERLNNFNRLKRRLQKTAESKQQTLLYPDQVLRDKTEKLQHYFESERKVQITAVTPSPKAVLSADSDS